MPRLRRSAEQIHTIDNARERLRGAIRFLLSECVPFLPFILIDYLWPGTWQQTILLELAGIAVYFVVHGAEVFRAYLRSIQGLVYALLYHLIAAAHMMDGFLIDGAIFDPLDTLPTPYLVLVLSLSVWLILWSMARGLREQRPETGCGLLLVHGFKLLIGLMILDCLWLLGLVGLIATAPHVLRYESLLFPIADALFILSAYLAARTADYRTKSASM